MSAAVVFLVCYVLIQHILTRVHMTYEKLKMLCAVENRDQIKLC